MGDGSLNADAAEQASQFRFRISDISPVPDDDVLAVITAALNEAWPQPSAAPTTVVSAGDTQWRFGQRRWRARQIPRQTWGRAQR